jgi:ParB family chromosome partitioning protein
VIEPVVVTPREDKFLLLAGELRYRASMKLGLATIPARILPNVESEEEVLTIQLIENLQRREIDPIDKANAILAFFRNRHGEMAVATVMNNLILYGREDQRASDEIVATVATISKITGMKTRTLQNILSLLILPSKIRDAVKTGVVPVSQGYILAANLENPGLMTVFEGILADPVTNKRLTELLKKAAEDAAAPPAEAPSPFRSVYTVGETLTNRLLDGKVRYDINELENLHLYFLSVIEVIEKAKAGGGTAKAPTVLP